MHVANATEVPVNIVGSSVFGRYPKISTERTYNMFVSDEWLVNYAGFQARSILTTRGQGRALFHSTRGNFLLAVVASSVYRISLPNLAPTFLSNIDTLLGEVSIAENLASQICIVDGQKAYIYNYTANSFTPQTLTFGGNPVIPNYVSYHNSFFLIAPNPASVNPQNWYVFERATDSTIQVNAQFAIQTKSDTALAAFPIPGRGNNILVLGSTVGEVWTQVGEVVGGVAVSYARVQSFNIDYGCVSVSTIAASDTFVCWLGQNKNSAPSVMMTDGSSVKRISTDGIDHLMETLQRPDRSTAIFYRQDGHIFYQFTFFDRNDNLTLAYDLMHDAFYHITDEKLNYHPARQIVFADQGTFFVSLNDGTLYQTGTQFTQYNYSLDAQAQGDVIPRIRVPKTIRLQNGHRFRAGRFGFWLEQGQNEFFLLNADNDEFCDGELIVEGGDGFILAENGDKLLAEDGYCITNANRPAVDLSFSKNGNASFSNRVRRLLNAQGVHRNEIEWSRMGQANELTLQLEFWGAQRWVCSNGTLEVY